MRNITQLIFVVMINANFPQDGYALNASMNKFIIMTSLILKIDLNLYLNFRKIMINFGVESNNSKHLC